MTSDPETVDDTDAHTFDPQLSSSRAVNLSLNKISVCVTVEQLEELLLNLFVLCEPGVQQCVIVMTSPTHTQVQFDMNLKRRRCKINPLTLK